MKAVPLGSLTLGDELGKGGQGTVRIVEEPNSGRYVYKEYREPGTIDFDALGAFPEVLGAMRPGEQAYLRSRTSWPEIIVAADGRPSGFLMTRVPDDYFHVSATSGKRRLRDLQALFNGHEYAARQYGIDYRPTHPYLLLIEIARLLDFLHARGIRVGDISPRNIAFRIDPNPAIHLIDCDAMTIGGRVVAPPVETPGWEVPVPFGGRREPLGTDAADVYKFGLIALRLLTGAQEPRTIDSLPDGAPFDVRELLSRTLADDPGLRPPIGAWPAVLARHARTTDSWVDRPAPAPVVVAVNRTARGHKHSTVKPSTAPTPTAPAKAPTGGRPSGTISGRAVLAIAAVVVTIAAIAAFLISAGSASTSLSRTTSNVRYATSTYSTTYTTATSTSSAPFATDGRALRSIAGSTSCGWPLVRSSGTTTSGPYGPMSNEIYNARGCVALTRSEVLEWCNTVYPTENGMCGFYGSDTIRPQLVLLRTACLTRAGLTAFREAGLTDDCLARR